MASIGRLTTRVWRLERKLPPQSERRTARRVRDPEAEVLELLAEAGLTLDDVGADGFARLVAILRASPADGIPGKLELDRDALRDLVLAAASD